MQDQGSPDGFAVPAVRQADNVRPEWVDMAKTAGYPGGPGYLGSEPPQLDGDHVPVPPRGGQATPAVIHDLEPTDSYFDADPSAATADGDEWGKEDKLEKERRKSVADSHYEKFVAEQLTKIKTDDSVGVYEDEFEAQLD